LPVAVEGSEKQGPGGGPGFVRGGEGRATRIPARQEQRRRVARMLTDLHGKAPSGMMEQEAAVERNFLPPRRGTRGPGSLAGVTGGFEAVRATTGQVGFGCWGGIRGNGGQEVAAASERAGQGPLRGRRTMMDAGRP